ncbi:hypothetical protein VNO80_05799 [Phaseolus coccineus]|uniref:Uncharacterized protein n=1 Tax=Phaseolus coccineus TaxID=3886 RepID=A0AAN9NGD1_PHACN
MHPKYSCIQKFSSVLLSTVSIKAVCPSAAAIVCSGKAVFYLDSYCLMPITATFPLDLVRRRKQLEGAGGRARVYTTGLYGVFRHIIQTEGLRGLYRGILPEYYKVVPGVGICFMTYETLKMLLSDIATG